MSSSLARKERKLLAGWLEAAASLWILLSSCLACECHGASLDSSGAEGRREASISPRRRVEATWAGRRGGQRKEGGREKARQGPQRSDRLQRFPEAEPSFGGEDPAEDQTPQESNRAEAPPTRTASSNSSLVGPPTWQHRPMAAQKPRPFSRMAAQRPRP